MSSVLPTYQVGYLAYKKERVDVELFLLNLQEDKEERERERALGGFVRYRLINIDFVFLLLYTYIEFLLTQPPFSRLCTNFSIR